MSTSWKENIAKGKTDQTVKCFCYNWYKVKSWHHIGIIEVINTIRYEGFPHHKLFILLILLGLLTLTTLITQWHICIHNCSIVTVLFLHMTIWHYGLRSKKGGWVTDYSATLLWLLEHLRSKERQHYSADWVTWSLNFSEVIWCFTIEGRGHDGAQTE